MDNYRELEDRYLTPPEDDDEIKTDDELQDVPDDGDYDEGQYELYCEAQEHWLWG